MPEDEDLAARIRELLGRGPEIGEKRMFGGLAFLSEGHMVVAASGRGGLMARVDPDETEAARAEPHAAPMVMSGREVSGWVRVEAADDATLRHWVDRALAYVRTLPPK